MKSFAYHAPDSLSEALTLQSEEAAPSWVMAGGTVNLITGPADLTGTRTSVADTDSVGYTNVTAGSRTTATTGRSVVKAAKEVVEQMQGGATQGIGRALYEGYHYDSEGNLLNPTLLDYRLPTILDVPPIDAVIVEVPYPKHPYGVRGVGETPIVPPPAALANAIHRAIGARVFRLLLSPARILEATGTIQQESS